MLLGSLLVYPLPGKIWIISLLSTLSRLPQAITCRCWHVSLYAHATFICTGNVPLLTSFSVLCLDFIDNVPILACFLQCYTSTFTSNLPIVIQHFFVSFSASSRQFSHRLLADRPSIIFLTSKLIDSWYQRHGNHECHMRAKLGLLSHK